MMTNGTMLIKNEIQTPLLDSSLMVVSTLCVAAKEVISLNVESFGKTIVVKLVDFVLVEPRIESPLLLLTVCSSLYFPLIL